MKKPNYNMERKDRERAKQAKAEAKLEKRAAKGEEGRPPELPMTGDDAGSQNADAQPQPNRPNS